MILNNMFVQNDVIGTALQASSLRNEVIQNNLANSDVPNYKKKVVVFEEALANAIQKSNQTGRLQLDKAIPRIQAIHENLNYRMDGNNVDVDTEMMSLYKNSMQYDTMVSSIMNNYSRINLVLNAK